MAVNVACIQFHPILGDVTQNLGKMKTLIEQVMAEKPDTDLIVLPELATTGYECGEDFSRLAETVGQGTSLTFMSRLAKRLRVKLVFGFAEREVDLLYNSAALIGEDGELIGVYRKVHLFDTEKRYFKAGDNYPVFETNIGHLAMMICWDAAFPEVARTYALKNADLLVIPTNWEKPYQDDWDLLTRARAFDNTIYVASANRVGPDVTLDWFGHSNIIDPQGKPLAQFNDEVEGYITATLDFGHARRLRASYYTFFKDRRPETYGQLTQPV